MKKTTLAAVLALVFLFYCADSAPAQSKAKDSAPYTGNGGKDLSLAILVPSASGLAAEQNYLPTMVQGVLVGDIAKYSAIRVLDRQTLEKTLKETESGIYKNDADYGQLGEIANVDYALTGNIAKTASGYAMQIQVVGTGKKTIGITKASYSGSCTIAELDNFTGIRKASLELLTQMGVALTADAKKELSGAGQTDYVNAQTALAQGITAQRQGTEVAALSYYFQAAAFDPSLAEALSRSSVLNANISSGNIGDNVRNDIQWRKDWVARLTETERFVDNFNKNVGIPHTLFYGDEIEQGAVNYQAGTVALSIQTYLHGNGIRLVSVKRAIQAVINGLNGTKRAEDWGLYRWPSQTVTNLKPFTEQNKNFSVGFELLNNQNEVIGRQTIQIGDIWKYEFFDLRGNEMRISTRVEKDMDHRSTIVGVNPTNRINVLFPNADANKITNGLIIQNADIIIPKDPDTGYINIGFVQRIPASVVFSNVDANKITDRLTIRIASVNGTDAETAARNGILQIRALPQSEFNYYANCRIEMGYLLRDGNFIGSGDKYVVPNIVWDEPVTAIGKGGSSWLFETYSVTIPDSVTFISCNPETIAFLGVGSPHHYGMTTFRGGSISIGKNVSIQEPYFSDEIKRKWRDFFIAYESFQDLYYKNGKKAGTYTLSSDKKGNPRWSYSPNREEYKPSQYTQNSATIHSGPRIKSR